MKDDLQIYENGNEKYSWSVVIQENIILGLWIAIGTLLCRQLSRFWGILYLTFAAVMILVVMRKLICTKCYYYCNRSYNPFRQLHIHAE